MPLPFCCPELREHRNFLPIGAWVFLAFSVSISVDPDLVLAQPGLPKHSEESLRTFQQFEHDRSPGPVPAQIPPANPDSPLPESFSRPNGSAIPGAPSGLGEVHALERSQVPPTQDNQSFYMGIQHLSQEKLEEAVTAFSEALASDPQNTDAFLNRAEAYRLLKKYDLCEKDASEALRLSELGWTSRRGRSVIDFSEKRNRESIIRLAYEKRAEANFFLGRDRASIDDYTKAISYGSFRAGVYFYRGEAFYNLGEFTRAVSDYSRAFELGSDEAELYCLRGLANLQLRNTEEAERDFQSAFLRDPSLRIRYQEEILNIKKKISQTAAAQPTR